VVTTRSGLKYVDTRIGGGAPVQPGQLLILDYRSRLQPASSILTVN
jgi:hypothetical protein